MKDIIRIVRYSWELKRYYLWTAALVTLVSVLNQTTPFLLKYIVDGLVAAGHHQHVPTSYFIWLLLAILTIAIANTLISNVQGYIGDRLAAKLGTLLSQRYLDHILSLPLAYYDNEVAGRITSRLDRSINTITNLMNAFANNFIGFFLTAAFTLIILAIYAWPVALALAILFPVYIWITTLSTADWQTHQQTINADTDMAQGRFVEAVSQVRAVKSFVQEVTESRFFARRRSAIERRTRQQSKGWHYYDTVRRLALNVIFFFIYAYIVLETWHGRYSLGDLTLLLQLVTQAQFPLFASSFIVENIQQASAGSKDFFGVMAITPSIADPAGAGTLAVTKGAVQFDKVSFAYDTDHPVLADISFTMNPGAKVALVGESGEGKTTISNLLCRFYALTGGRITIDGEDISTVTQESLRRSITVVFQEPTLFSGTVAENIAYAKPDATQDEITQAAAAANALGFIDNLPHKFKTQIGERGVKLSGGQKQRLAIARAILKDAPILILDEATASLDSKAEVEVHRGLEALMQRRTTLIIAHRLATIASVDWIIGLQGGRISEQGTPSELAHGDGIYAQLLELQRPKAADLAKLKAYDMA